MTAPNSGHAPAFRMIRAIVLRKAVGCVSDAADSTPCRWEDDPFCGMRRRIQAKCSENAPLR